MPEDVLSETTPAPEVSLWSETSKKLSSATDSQSTSEDRVFGVQEKSEGDLLTELESLDTKIEALVSRCEELQHLNEVLTAQLAKEREAKAALLDVQSNAKKRVDQLIQRLQGIAEAG